VHPTVVVGGVDVVGHRGGLRVLAERRVVVGGARRLHRPQRDALHRRQEDALADEPVGLGGALPEQPLLEAGAEDVGDRLVERPGLALVGEVGRELRDGVGQLVPQHVDGLGEAPEDLAVTVTEDQLGAVPERVVVVLAEVDRD
jgi:hypothetical protein